MTTKYELALQLIGGLAVATISNSDQLPVMFTMNVISIPKANLVN